MSVSFHIYQLSAFHPTWGHVFLLLSSLVISHWIPDVVNFTLLRSEWYNFPKHITALCSRTSLYGNSFTLPDNDFKIYLAGSELWWALGPPAAQSWGRTLSPKPTSHELASLAGMNSYCSQPCARTGHYFHETLPAVFPLTTCLIPHAFADPLAAGGFPLLISGILSHCFLIWYSLNPRPSLEALSKQQSPGIIGLVYLLLVSQG